MAEGPTTSAPEGRRGCAQCGLPVPLRGPAARTSPGAWTYCCTGCSLAAQLAQGESSGSDQLLSRVLLAAFLATGVMVVSIAMYGDALAGAETAEHASEASRALGGLYRLAALALSLPTAALIGLPLARAVRTAGRWLSVDVWILIGAAAAFALSAWNTLVSEGPVYFETATMILVLVGLGKWIDVKAKERARGELDRVLPLTRPAATRVVAGEEHAVAAPDLVVGDLVRVRPGERLPVDGRVAEGRAFLDTALLTGESVPRSAGPGASVLAGSRVLDGTLLVRTEAAFGDRSCDAMQRLLEGAMQVRGSHERLAERLAAVMVPTVLAAAVLALARAVWLGQPEQGVVRALAVLLVACPCALGIATPLAFWTALSRTWERHALVKGSRVLERLARARRAWFDKTGTLTEGRLELVDVLPAVGEPGPPDRREALRLAAACEVGSEHPVGVALRQAWRDEFGSPLPRASAFRALPGIGVEARIGRRLVELRRESGPVPAEGGAGHARVALMVDGAERARFELRDSTRVEAARVVRQLQERGLTLGVLSGDGRGPVEALGRELGLVAEGELLPHEKVERIEAEGDGALFVGDGLNDGAALARAGVGIAVQGGSTASLEAADVLLLAPGLDVLPDLVDIARTAVRTARLNLAWCLVYNVIGVGLAVIGALTPVLAASGMIASGAGVLANTTRAFARFRRGDGEGEERPGSPGQGARSPRGPSTHHVGGAMSQTAPILGVGDAANP